MIWSFFPLCPDKGGQFRWWSRADRCWWQSYQRHRPLPKHFCQWHQALRSSPRFNNLRKLHKCHSWHQQQGIPHNWGKERNSIIFLVFGVTTLCCMPDLGNCLMSTKITGFEAKSFHTGGLGKSGDQFGEETNRWFLIKELESQFWLSTKFFGPDLVVGIFVHCRLTHLHDWLTTCMLHGWFIHATVQSPVLEGVALSWAYFKQEQPAQAAVWNVRDRCGTCQTYDACAVLAKAQKLVFAGVAISRGCSNQTKTSLNCIEVTVPPFKRATAEERGYFKCDLAWVEPSSRRRAVLQV